MKQIMKRCTSLVLVLCLAMSLVALPGVITAKAVTTGNLIYSNNMDEGEQEASGGVNFWVPFDFNRSNQPAFSSSFVADGDNTYFDMRMDADGQAAAAYLYMENEAMDTTSVLKYRMMVNNDNAEDGWTLYPLRFGTGTKDSTTIGIQIKDYVLSYNKQTMTLEKDTWYDFKIELNGSDVALYINEDPFTTAEGVLTDVTLGYLVMGIFANSKNNRANVGFSIDDVAVYEYGTTGEEPGGDTGEEPTDPDTDEIEYGDLIHSNAMDALTTDDGNPYYPMGWTKSEDAQNALGSSIIASADRTYYQMKRSGAEEEAISWATAAPITDYSAVILKYDVMIDNGDITEYSVYLPAFTNGDKSRAIAVNVKDGVLGGTEMTLTPGTWYTFELVLNGSDWALYVAGEKVREGTLTEEQTITCLNMGIGNYGGNPTDSQTAGAGVAFNIDNLEIWGTTGEIIGGDPGEEPSNPGTDEIEYGNELYSNAMDTYEGESKYPTGWTRSGENAFASSIITSANRTYYQMKRNGTESTSGRSYATTTPITDYSAVILKYDVMIDNGDLTGWSVYLPAFTSGAKARAIGITVSDNALVGTEMTLTPGTWYTFELVLNGSDWALYVAGDKVKEGTLAEGTTIACLNMGISNAGGNTAEGLTAGADVAFNIDNLKIYKYGSAGAETELFALNGSLVNLGNDLDMKFFIKPTDLTEGKTYTAKMVRTYADGSTDTQEETVSKVYSDGDYYVSYKGLAAKEMGDKIAVTIYDSEGNAVSQVWNDSIKEYAIRALAKYSDNANTVEMIKDLLNYGAAAQTAFGYDAQNLVNADVNKVVPEVTGTDVSASNDRTYWSGARLRLRSNITFKAYFKSDKVTRDMTAEVSFTNYKDAPVSYTVAGTAFGQDTNDTDLYVPVTGLVIGDTDTVITIVIKDAEGNEVVTVTDSIASYVVRYNSLANADADFVALNKAIMALGASVEAAL